MESKDEKMGRSNQLEKLKVFYTMNILKANNGCSWHLFSISFIVCGYKQWCLLWQQINTWLIQFQVATCPFMLEPAKKPLRVKKKIGQSYILCGSHDAQLQSSVLLSRAMDAREVNTYINITL